MKNIFLLLLVGYTTFLSAQIDSSHIEKQAVIKTIQALFDGMRAGDSTALRAVLHPSAHLQSSFTNDDGLAVLREGSIDRWVTSVGSPHDQVYDEKIWSYKINIADNLATAWTDYTFYLGEVFSHCGVNAFHLINTADGWKISHITDTRRRDNCIKEMPDAEKNIHSLLDNWHKAAATADETVFFGSMTPEGIYIGTDAGERWQRDEMKEWSKKYFEQESAWDFTPMKRTVYLNENGETAWFEESLDTWMGECRASGVLQQTKEGWKISHYHLSVTVPNENVDQFLPLATPSSKKKQ